MRSKIFTIDKSILLILIVVGVSQAEWSSWGEYGDCSRPCGGGLTNKTRTCLGATQTCDGTDIRYKVCNPEGCGSLNQTLRALQCQSYDNVAIKDNYFHWVPYVNPSEPCVLYCRTVETDFVLKMAEEVWNGTRCDSHGNGVCIQGRCKKVGCNGIVGSRREFDVCGVCGGNGSTCVSELEDSKVDVDRPWLDRDEKKYQWDVRWSPCSERCGLWISRPDSDIWVCPHCEKIITDKFRHISSDCLLTVQIKDEFRKGTQTSTVMCVTSDTSYDVSDVFCPPSQKPEVPGTRVCYESHACKYKYRWHAFKWGSCSRTCGDGHKYRRVICLKQERTSSPKRVNDRKCTDVKPDLKAPCNLGDCPEWLSGPWSKCSVPCGYGQQKRKVVCKTSTSAYCAQKSKPATIQKCYSGKSCGAPGIQQDDSAADKYDFYDDAKLRELLIFPEFKVTPWGPCTVTCGVGYMYRNVTCLRGETIVSLSQCQGIEPHSKRECHRANCPVSDAPGTDLAYAWRHGQFGPCSRSCGRGIQASVLQCTDVTNNKAVLDFYCTDVAKPDPITQYCSATPCPPSWKVGDYSECTVPCGGGRESRDVGCIQITAYGGELPVPDHRCPDPIPLSERSCNTQFCQAEWSTDVWGECSVTCGLGVETRAVYCVKYVKTGVKVNVSGTECIGPRPETTRQCHFGDCYKLNHLPAIKEQKGTFIQIKRTKRIGLVIGETAVLLPNQAVKIRCPVKNYHRKLIFWTKGHRLVRLIGRVRVSSNGALRISRADPLLDSGTYTCSAGMLLATINITFHTKKEAKRQANQILQNIFKENLNESFINRPQKDEMLKMKSNKHFHINAIPLNGYDYSSFSTSNWTNCSAKCGWGTQTRIVTCNQVTDKFIRLMPEEECARKGLDKPTSVQKCAIQKECPKWVTGGWSECSAQFCREDGYAVQKRSVHCELANGTKTHLHVCDILPRPEHKQTCANASCVALWRTSPWSECTPRCGVKGKKLRSLTCVWAETKTPAFDSCKHKPRPKVSKACKPSACRPLVSCADESRYCSLAGHLKMCRYARFRSKCCLTCRNANL